MTPFARLKNAFLLFLTICILGGISGVYLHDSNIRLLPVIKTAFASTENLWQGSKEKAQSLTDASMIALNFKQPEMPQFKGLVVDDAMLGNTAKAQEDGVMIERRLRYIRTIEWPQPSKYAQALAGTSRDIYTSANNAIDNTLNNTWKTLSSWHAAITEKTNALFSIPGKIQDYSFNKAAELTNALGQGIYSAYNFVSNFVSSSIQSGIDAVAHVFSTINKGLDNGYTGLKSAALNFHQSSVSGMGKAIHSISSIPQILAQKIEATKDFEFKNILSYEPAAGDEEPFEMAEAAEDPELDNIAKSQEPDLPPEENYKYEPEETTLDIEGVLVPQSSTVISSSRDGQIAKINFDNGDMFQKGDILIEYDCSDVKAELEAAEAEKTLTGKRSSRNNKLFKLDIISDIEDLGFKTEDIKASAQAKIIEHRMEQCYIRAAYDGRVTNRLANEHEFTRTDRVLMEVASLDDLELEFLVPSIWLRWVNVDAPISITVNETAESYDATITRIYGEIDPVSQSIQMSAKLAPYESPLLPGMSGTITLDITRIRDAGIKGFLEQPRYAGQGSSAKAAE